MPGCLRHMTRSGWWRDMLLVVYGNLGGVYNRERGRGERSRSWRLKRSESCEGAREKERKKASRKRKWRKKDGRMIGPCSVGPFWYATLASRVMSAIAKTVPQNSYREEDVRELHSRLDS